MACYSAFRQMIDINKPLSTLFLLKLDDNDWSLVEDDFEEFKEAEVKSLKDICFDSIKENFDRYVQTYANENSDKVLQTHLLFLQKKYSGELLLHFRNGGVPEQYLHFLLNKNLKEINLEDFRNCKIKDVMVQIEMIGESVLKFQVRNLSHLDDELLLNPLNDLIKVQSINQLFKKMLSCIPNVEELYFSSACTDEILETVSSFANLKKLYLLDGTAVTESGIIKFCSQFENRNHSLNTLSLKTLLLSECTIKTILSKFPSLQVLEYPYLVPTLIRMNKDNLLSRTVNNIRFITNLTVLEPIEPELLERGTFGADLIFKILSEICPNIKELSVKFLFNRSLKCPNFQFSKLERLKLEGLLTYINDMPTFSSSLRHISFKNVSFSVLSMLKCCSKLDSLELNLVEFRRVEDDDTDMEKYATNIKELNLYGTIKLNTRYDLSDFEIVFGSCPRLENLTLDSCVFPEEEDKNKSLVNSISNVPLQKLNIFRSNVKPDFVSSLLVSCKSLQNIVLDKCFHITPEDITSLYEIAKMNQVKIRYRDVYRTSYISSDDYLYESDYDYDYYSGYDTDDD